MPTTPLTDDPETGRAGRARVPRRRPSTSRARASTTPTTARKQAQPREGAPTRARRRSPRTSTSKSATASESRLGGDSSDVGRPSSSTPSSSAVDARRADAEQPADGCQPPARGSCRTRSTPLEERARDRQRLLTAVGQPSRRAVRCRARRVCGVPADRRARRTGRAASGRSCRCGAPSAPSRRSTAGGRTPPARAARLLHRARGSAAGAARG